ncbi:MAG: hypothetical protein ACXIUV_11455 [Alkalilacustris sp.]
MWETFGGTATDALSAIAVQGRNARDVLAGMVAQLAQAAWQATLMGRGPLAGVLGGGGLFPALIPTLRRAGGGPLGVLRVELSGDLEARVVKLAAGVTVEAVKSYDRDLSRRLQDIAADPMVVGR